MSLARPQTVSICGGYGGEWNRVGEIGRDRESVCVKKEKKGLTRVRYKWVLEEKDIGRMVEIGKLSI